MKIKQKGFIGVLFAIIITLATVGVGAYLYLNRNNSDFLSTNLPLLESSKKTENIPIDPNIQNNTVADEVITKSSEHDGPIQVYGRVNKDVTQVIEEANSLISSNKIISSQLENTLQIGYMKETLDRNVSLLTSTDQEVINLRKIYDSQWFLESFIRSKILELKEALKKAETIIKVANEIGYKATDNYSSIYYMVLDENELHLYQRSKIGHLFQLVKSGDQLIIFSEIKKGVVYRDSIITTIDNII